MHAAVILSIEYPNSHPKVDILKTRKRKCGGNAVGKIKRK
jgi:hypothetical protein